MFTRKEQGSPKAVNAKASQTAVAPPKAAQVATHSAVTAIANPNAVTAADAKTVAREAIQNDPYVIVGTGGRPPNSI